MQKILEISIQTKIKKQKKCFEAYCYLLALFKTIKSDFWKKFELKTIKTVEKNFLA